MSIADVWPLLLGAVYDALNLNWGSLVYRQGPDVIKAAVFIGAVFFTAIVVKKLRKKNSSYYSESGMNFSRQHKLGLGYKLARAFVWCLLAVSLFFLAVALADPVVVMTNITEQNESRELIYVNDVSSSNGFHLPNSSLTRGELARETLNKLILKRRDKKDRAAYIIFGTYSDIWSGFTTSYDSLSFSVSMSPMAIAPPEAQKIWPGMFILKKGQYVEQDNGGSTNLHLGLESAIYLFDRKGSPKVTEELKNNPSAKMRSVVVITDGAADVDPEPQFRELQKRHIIPYLIFVDPDRTIERTLFGPESIKAKLPDHLLMMVRRYGGQYFLAKDKESINRISGELDKLQSIKQAKLVSTREDEVYFVPLALSFLFAASALGLRFLLLFVWRVV